MKNLGVGTYIKDVSRLKDINPTNNEHFLKRIFTDSELDYCFSKSNLS